MRGRLFVSLTLLLLAWTATAADWPFWGGDIRNTHNASSETAISVDNVGTLTVDWIYDAGGSVSAIPTVAGDIMYFTDWGPALGGLLAQPALPGGRLHAVNRITGEPLWTRNISEYGASIYSNISRSSPAIAGDTASAPPLLWLMTGIAAAGLGINALQIGMYAVSAHIYPTVCRSAGVGWALGVGRVGGFLSAFYGAALFAQSGARGFFVGIGCALVLAFVGVVMIRRHIPPAMR